MWHAIKVTVYDAIRPPLIEAKAEVQGPRLGRCLEVMASELGRIHDASRSKCPCRAKGLLLMAIELTTWDSLSSYEQQDEGDAAYLHAMKGFAATALCSGSGLPQTGTRTSPSDSSPN